MPKKLNAKKIIVLLLILSVIIVIALVILNRNNVEVTDALASTATVKITAQPITTTDIIIEDNTNFATEKTLPKKSFIGSGESTNSWLGIRFPLNQNLKTITKASISLYSEDAQWINIDTEIYLENASASNPFSSSAKASKRKLTSSKIAYKNNVKWNKNSSYEIDITKPVQEVLTLNQDVKALTVVFKNTNTGKFARKFISTDLSNTATIPKLNIEYAGSVTTPTLPPSNPPPTTQPPAPQPQQPAPPPTEIPTTPEPVPTPPPAEVPVPTPTPEPTPPPQASSPDTVYVATSGSDSNTGTNDKPFKTIQKGIDYLNSNFSTKNNLVVKGGVYRESPTIKNFNPNKTVTISSETSSNPAQIYGSESSQDSRITWQKGTGGLNFPSSAANNVYYADVSAWGADPEIAYLNGTVDTRMNKAREPDIDPFADTSVTDNRWSAQSGTLGGLVDTKNLKNINGFSSTFLTGGRIFVTDGYSGHDHNTATITGVVASSGQLYFDKEMKYYNGQPLIAANSKFYVEGKSELLDMPGEWFFDIKTKRLYVWSINSDNPAKSNIEFGVRANGIKVINSQNVIIKDFNIKFTNYLYGGSTGNDGAIFLVNNQNEKSSNITFDNVNVRNSAFGVRIFQSTNKRNLMQNITFKNSVIENIDGIGFIAFQHPYFDANNNYIPGIKNLIIENNNIKKAGYRPAGNGGLMWILKVQNFILKNNLIEESAHNGVEVQVSPESNVLVQNNLFRNNCLSGTDCGGFKIYGNTISARNVLIANNVSTGTKGCSEVSRLIGDWPTSQTFGCGGFGFYTDIIKATNKAEPAAIFYKNLSEGNYYSGIHLTRSSRINVLDNIFNNNPFGITATSRNENEQKLESSKFTNNIFSRTNDVNNGTYNYFGAIINKYDYGINIPFESESDKTNITINNNIYKMVGRSAFDIYTRQISKANNQASLKTVQDVQNKTTWEDSGKDSFGNIPGYSSQGYDTTQARSSFNYVSPIPSEVINVVSKLEQAFGIKITIDNYVGRK